MTRFSSKWILSHSTWYKFRRSHHAKLLAITMICDFCHSFAFYLDLPQA
jgi:hypothetical protein